QRYGQSRMEAQSTQTDITVLNPAVPPAKHSSPKVLLNIVLSVFLGTLLGVGIGFLVELLDRRVRSGQDIAGLEIPVLAEVTKKGRRLEKLRRLFSRNRPAMA
ncbi:MAG: chain-length determining protein, partial [Hydrogenophilales bacterium 17-62-8]